MLQGVTQAHLQQTWQAVCSSTSTSIQQGRGHKIPGLCTVLPAAGGVKVLVSDTLLKFAPQLQLGQGCVHHASVRQQVQGVDTINTASLAHRCGSDTSRSRLMQQSPREEQQHSSADRNSKQCAGATHSHASCPAGVLNASTRTRSS